MRRYVSIFASIGISISLLTGTARAAEPTTAAAVEEVNKICPISGKPVDPKITVVYEGKTYAFADGVCRTKFNEARENSLYQKLGGKAARTGCTTAFNTRGKPMTRG